MHTPVKVYKATVFLPNPRGSNIHRECVVINLHANFEVPSFKHPRDMAGFKILKVGHMILSHDLILHFSLVPLVVNMHAKFEVSSSNLSRDMKGFQNSK